MSEELAILVNCWENVDNSEDELIHNIINFINTRPEIKFIVLASYDVPYNDQYKTLWKINYENVFNNTVVSQIKFLTNLAEYNRFLIEKDSTVSLEKTDTLLLNTVFENKFQISMNFFFELEYFLKINNNIDTIWFFGRNWNDDLKHRELGWLHMKSLLDKELLTNSDCITPIGYKVSNDRKWANELNSHKLYRYVDLM